ncbi:LysR family transcriptional regulator [Pseudonocardia spinosispora]|uniref:LysR family transcriptional regulator n=1 Tax=Pseudonocardia spinosispora TaxID=103441 RepID=UPI0003FADD50|nr:LysR family transcriptional regulator [Pseudonocardia spinosispora]
MDERIVDANLVVALDALLAEHSVTRAAQRLRTSPAAMSRTLSRLRRLLDDPLLVRAGQRMVPTPRADALRDEAAAVVRRCGALLAPDVAVDPATLRRTFTVQAADILAAALGPGLLEVTGTEAPGVSLRFRSEEVEGGPALRDGRTDLEVGSLDRLDPEIHSEPLATLRMTAGVRAGHSLTMGEVTPARFASAHHISVSRRGRFTGPIDVALAEQNLHRRVVTVLPSHVAAMAVAARTDLVCLIPTPSEGGSRGPFAALASDFGLHLIEIPLSLPAVVIGMAWHPRHDADGGHEWMRSAVRRVLQVPATAGPCPPSPVASTSEDDAAPVRKCELGAIRPAGHAR